MPIDIDIREHEVLGPMLKAARREGREEGRREGHREEREEGVREGKLTILRLLIEKRFGALPVWAGEKLAALPEPQLEDVIERVLDATSLDELLG
jgi:hypothetical protein